MSYWNVTPHVHDVPLALVDSTGQVVVVVVFGVIALLAIVVQFLKFQAMFGDGDSTDHERQINCPSCGARIAAEADACEYCGDPIDR